MFSRLNGLVGISSILSKHLHKSFDSSERKLNYLKICLQMPLVLYSKHAICASIPSQSNSPKIHHRTSSNFQIIARFFHLLLLFTPSLLTLPFVFIPPLQKVWIKIFVWSVEKAGVVWIKLFQYLSHRRDVIG